MKKLHWLSPGLAAVSKNLPKYLNSWQNTEVKFETMISDLKCRISPLNRLKKQSACIGLEGPWT